jgi:hypothetical protein
MAENKDFPKVILKRAKIQHMIDFCLDESIEFSVRQQQFPDTDWEVELTVNDVQTALLVGMFLRDNRFDVDGIEEDRYKKGGVNSSNGKKTSKSSKTSSSKDKEETNETVKEEKSEDIKDKQKIFQDNAAPEDAKKGKDNISQVAEGLIDKEVKDEFDNQQSPGLGF